MINTGPFCRNVCSEIITVAINKFLFRIWIIILILINMYLFYWWAIFKDYWFMSHDHSIPSFFPPSCCSDEAVIGQYNLNVTFLHLTTYHLTSLPFHHNPLALAVVCLSMHHHNIAKLLKCYLKLTVQQSTHFTWQFDYKHSVVTLPTLRQDY